MRLTLRSIGAQIYSLHRLTARMVVFTRSKNIFRSTFNLITESLHACSYVILRNVNGLDLSYYAQSIHSESAPQSPYNYTEDDLFRPETPPLRQPSLPPGHEDENAVEYAEDMLEMRSDFSAPPDHAALASDDSTFNRTGADLRIASDTGLLFPPSDQEFARITKEFKREAMDTAAALAMRPSSSVPCSLRPLAQSYIPSSSPGPILQSESQHLVSPRPVLHTPPPRIGLNRKRKRLSTPEDEEDNNAGNIAGPITSVAQFNGDVPLRVKAEKPDERSPVKRRRLLTRQPSQDSQMFLAAGYAGSHDDGIADKRLDLISRQPSWDSQMFLEAGYAPPPPANPPTDGNPIEPSRGRSEGGIKPTAIIPAGLRVSQCSLPALIVGDNRATSMENAQLRLETPVKSQIPVGASGLVPGDVFGPVVFSAKASKISDRFPAERSKKDVDGTAMSDSERDGAEVEAESRDTVKPLCSPKKKRGTGARARKQKAIPSVEPDPAINPEDGLSSISASKRPLKLRRGRSAAVQPEDPLSKVPVRKSTRRRK